MPERNWNEQHKQQMSEMLLFSEGWTDCPGWGVVDHDCVHQVDVAVGALQVRPQHFALDLLPGNEIVLVGICQVEKWKC